RDGADGREHAVAAAGPKIGGSATGHTDVRAEVGRIDRGRRDVNTSATARDGDTVGAEDAAVGTEGTAERHGRRVNQNASAGAAASDVSAVAAGTAVGQHAAADDDVADRPDLDPAASATPAAAGILAVIVNIIFAG